MTTRICAAIWLLVFSISASELLPADRRINWTANSGPEGGISYRTNVFTNFTSSVTLAQLNAAIADCPSNFVVLLAAGTYNFAGTVIIENDGVTVRGAGPTSTRIINTTSTQGNAGVYIGRNEYADFNVTPPAHVATWTSGFARGTTNITLSNVTNLSVGRLIGLDQLEDLKIVREAGAPEDCDYCSRESGSRGQIQIVKVLSITGTNITITPGLYMTNWNTAYTPEAFWHAGDHTERSSIEGIGITNAGGGVQYGIYCKNAANSWAYNCKMDGFTVGQWFTHFGFRNAVNKCIVTGGDGGSGSYAITGLIHSDTRIEDNISDGVGPAFVAGGASQGIVYFGNYQTNAYYTGSGGAWNVQSIGPHGSHCAYYLMEANHISNFYLDFIHGSASHNTVFRNRIPGRTYNSYADQVTTINTMPLAIQATNRYVNIIGNILGQSGYHTGYELAGVSSGDSSASIYVAGYYSTTITLTGYDYDVTNTILRSFNYDTVTSGIVSNGFAAGDVPASLLYPDGAPTTRSDGTVYWGGLPWPPYEPTAPGVVSDWNTISTNIPAGYRNAHSQSNPPAAGEGGAGATANVGTLRIGP